jgi:hypothetical protein
VRVIRNEGDRLGSHEDRLPLEYLRSHVKDGGRTVMPRVNKSFSPVEDPLRDMSWTVGRDIGPSSRRTGA